MKDIQRGMKGLTLDSQNRSKPAIPRAESSPPKFNSSDLFLVQENDHYTETFGHSWAPPQKFYTPGSTPVATRRSPIRPKITPAGCPPPLPTSAATTYNHFPSNITAGPQVFSYEKPSPHVFFSQPLSTSTMASGVPTITMQVPVTAVNGLCPTAYVPVYPTMATYQGFPTQYVEYSPGVIYPVGAMPTYYPQQVVSLTTPKMEDVACKLLEDFDKSIEDQSSCRFLQKQLEELSGKGNYDIVEKLYDKIAEKVGKYMCLPFGNYLCQKLFELLGEEQLYVILKRVKPDVVSIAQNLHGTRSIQQLIKVSLKSVYLVQEIIRILKGNVCEIIMDSNGNHVILLCILQLKAPYNDFIYNEIMENCLQVTKHKHGCCVMQKCILAATDLQRHKLTKKVVGLTKDLVQDQYGNYVIQCIIEQKLPSVNAEVWSFLKGNVLELSNEKFSSNAIEKLIEHSSAELRKEIVDEVVTFESYTDILLNPFGNYVVQKALEHATKEQREQMLRGVKASLGEVKARGGFGKKIATKLLKDYPELVE